MSTRNTLCWVDIPVLDLERAVRFYAAVLAQPVTVQEHEGFSFALLPGVETGVSGCLTPSGESAPGLSGPLIYLSVDGRLAEAVEVARQQGGEVFAPPHPIGPYGFRAVLRDSEGNRLALHSAS